MSLFPTIVTLSTETSFEIYQVPSVHIQTCPTVMVLKLVTSISIFCTDDWPTVASVDPNSFAACIAALRSQGFYAHTQACVVGSRPSRNRKHCLLIN